LKEPLNPLFDFIGIDYGSKKAGTTAVCWEEKGSLKVVQSEKQQDADLFIKNIAAKLRPGMVFIDAPLSLPGKYFGRGNDYFYREADREVNAMSPMFIGGLTARAIQLTDELNENGIQCIEAYPSQLVKSVFVKHLALYKMKGAEKRFLEGLIPSLPAKPFGPDWTWHKIDSILAWYSGYRFRNGQHKTFGNPEEGIIIC
jgi:predicted nuclease with RNAse H fold